MNTDVISVADVDSPTTYVQGQPYPQAYPPQPTIQNTQHTQPMTYMGTESTWVKGQVMEDPPPFTGTPAYTGGPPPYIGAPPAYTEAPPPYY